jgi:hypothetical protein
MLAPWKGRLRLVALLLTRGADPDFESRGGRNAERWTDGDSEEAAELLRRFREEGSAALQPFLAPLPAVGSPSVGDSTDNVTRDVASPAGELDPSVNGGSRAAVKELGEAASGESRGDSEGAGL